MAKYIIALDQGTSSTRAIVFNDQGTAIASHQIELQQYYPQDGWVEHNPEEIWQAALNCVQMVFKKSKVAIKDIAALGISNQRETTILWDKNTGQPVYSAIVWQDRRTAGYCSELANDSLNSLIQTKTGLLLDPYFSATKIRWLLENIPGLAKKAANNQVAFGTIDSFLIWRLSGGKRHVTDATNASRTLLFNLQTQQWDEELLKFFSIPPAILPEVLDSSAEFARTEKKLLGEEIIIAGVAGDQQAALIGQACFKKGMIKSTYGTGCFVVINTGSEIIHSKNRLLSTVAYRLKGKVTYAIEGSIFSAGSIVKWLRDKVYLIETAADTERYALDVASTEGVYFVPAFTGLAAPYWHPYARGAIIGLSRNSERAHIVRAALEAIAYQTKDLLDAFVKDGVLLADIRVDGGMVANNWLLQYLANILNINVTKPKFIETTALGAAYLAGLHVDVYSSLEAIATQWQADQVYVPNFAESKRKDLYEGWLKAIKRVSL